MMKLLDIRREVQIHHPSHPRLRDVRKPAQLRLVSRRPLAQQLLKPDRKAPGKPRNPVGLDPMKGRSFAIMPAASLAPDVRYYYSLSAHLTNAKTATRMCSGLDQALQVGIGERFPAAVSARTGNNRCNYGRLVLSGSDKT